MAGENNTIYTTAALGYQHVQAADYLKGKEFAVYRMPGLTIGQKRIGVTVNEMELGKPYAYKDLLTMVLQNYKGQGVKKLNHDSKNHFCSEMVAYTFLKMGITLAPQLNKEPSGYTPNEVVDDVRLNML